MTGRSDALRGTTVEAAHDVSVGVDPYVDHVMHADARTVAAGADAVRDRRRDVTNARRVLQAEVDRRAVVDAVLLPRGQLLRLEPEVGGSVRVEDDRRPQPSRERGGDR